MIRKSQSCIKQGRTCLIEHLKFRGKMCLPYRTYQKRCHFVDSPKWFGDRDKKIIKFKFVSKCATLLTGNPSQSESLSSSSSSSYFCNELSLYVWLWMEGEWPPLVATNEVVYLRLSLTFSDELFLRFRIDMTSVFFRLIASASTVLVDDDVAALTFI